MSRNKYPKVVAVHTDGTTGTYRAACEILATLTAHKAEGRSLSDVVKVLYKGERWTDRCEGCRKTFKSKKPLRLYNGFVASLGNGIVNISSVTIPLPGAYCNDVCAFKWLESHYGDIKQFASCKEEDLPENKVKERKRKSKDIQRNLHKLAKKAAKQKERKMARSTKKSTKGTKKSKTTRKAAKKTTRARKETSGGISDEERLARRACRRIINRVRRGDKGVASKMQVMKETLREKGNSWEATYKALNNKFAKDLPVREKKDKPAKKAKAVKKARGTKKEKAAKKTRLAKSKTKAKAKAKTTKKTTRAAKPKKETARSKQATKRAKKTAPPVEPTKSKPEATDYVE